MSLKSKDPFRRLNYFSSIVGRIGTSIRNVQINLWRFVSCSDQTYFITRRKESEFVLVFTGVSMPECELKQPKVLEAWRAWYAYLGEAVVDPGNSFFPVMQTMLAIAVVVAAQGLDIVLQPKKRQ